MQKVTPKEQLTINNLKASKPARRNHFDFTDLDRKFPSRNELLGQKGETLFWNEGEPESSEAPIDLDQAENTISIWIPQDGLTPMKTEKIELKLDQQVVIDDIAKTLAQTENSGQESKAVLNVTIGGEAVMVEIVKRKNRTKVQFRAENSSVRRLLKNTKVELKDAAAKAGLNLHRIEVR